jgi:tetratricopeptide (TPR) repeat protein
MDNNAFTEFNTFLTTTPGGQMLLNLAASYAFQLLEAGRGWVTAQALGKPAQRGLRDAAQFAFAALLAEARKSYPHNRDVHEEAVGAAMQRLLAQPGVADRLLADALTAAELDLPWLEAQFGASGAAERLTAIPFDVGRCFRAWHAALAAALAQAAAVNTTLFPPWLVANAVAVRDKLDVVAAATARIEAKLDQLTPQAPPAPVPALVPAPRTNLLVGRADDLAWLCARLQAGGQAALVGVRGLGGIGKTELAIAAAQTVTPAFAGGVIWLECGAIDVAGVQQRLADALGVALPTSDLRQRADVLRSALATRAATLVVLDDVRYTHATAFDLLRPPAPPCALLVTSRRSDLPLRPGDILPLETFTPAQAEELLTFLLHEQGIPAAADTVAAIAALLDLPLAVGLAARRAAQLAQAQARRRGAVAAPGLPPVAALLAELGERRLAAIDQAGGDPLRPDLSVRLTFGMSYAGLSAADRRAFRCLGVLARNEFDAATAAALWAQPAAADAGQYTGQYADALRRLANAGLVEELGDGLWWLHDLLREYALERLAATPAEEHAARQAHARHFMQLLDALELRAVTDWEQLAFWQPEAALAAAWLTGHWVENAALAAEFFVTLAENFPGHLFPDLAQWLESGLAAARSAELTNATRRLQRHLGEYWQQHGEPVRAETYLRASLAAAETLLQKAGDDDEREAGQRGVAVTQSSLADLLRTRGQYDEAERLYRESLRVIEAVGDTRSVAVTQSSLADLLRTRGQYDEAERLYRESLRVLDQV